MIHKTHKKRITTLLIFLCSLSCLPIMAQSGSKSDVLGRLGSNVITTGVPFLLIAPDTRIGGMGEAGVAVENDVNAQHWNPSKYVFSENRFGASVSYSPWLAGLGLNDIYLLYLSGYGKVTENDAISASLRYFSMGNMDITNEDGELVMNSKPHEFALDIGYSRKLIEDLSMAISGRFIYSNLTTYTSTSAGRAKPGLSGAADVALFYNKKLSTKKLYSSKIAFGLNISNIGAKISYNSSAERDFLPANFRAGIAYTMGIDKYNKLTFAFDINKLLVTTPPTYQTDSSGNIVYGVDGLAVIDKGKRPSEVSAAAAVFSSWWDAPGGFVEEMKEFVLNFGIEYSYNDLLFLRTGYLNEAKTKGNRKYMTFGVGIKYSVFSIDAAYLLPLSTKNHPLENTFRITITLDFGNPKKSNA